MSSGCEDGDAADIPDFLLLILSGLLWVFFLDLDMEDDICVLNLFLFHKGVHTTLTGVHPLVGDGVLGGLAGGVVLHGGVVLPDGVLGLPTGVPVLPGDGVVGMMMLAPTWTW